jgi:hypothetical protein
VGVAQVDATLGLGFQPFLLAGRLRRLAGFEIVWFVLIMAGGNSMSLYAPPQLLGLPPDEPASALFRQKAA